MTSRATPRYLVQSVVHATNVLQAFESPGETLRLCDVVARTGLSKATCFRLLHTLHHCGLVAKVDAQRYRVTAALRRATRYRLGFADQGPHTSFNRDVQTGLVTAAEREGLELIVVDNRYRPKIALRNAEHLIREKVDLAIEFQTDEAIAPAIAARYQEAGIPLVAIDIPHPGGIYFGADNYRAGELAGRYLGKWARHRWDGKADEVLLLGLTRAGPLVRARMSGVVAGVRNVLHDLDPGVITSIDGDGQYGTSLERVRRHLRGSRATRVLVGAANDASALGAARAFQEAGRVSGCAIVGQNGELDARAELRSPRSPLVASVGYFPESYGDGLVRLALDVLAGRVVPPAVFVRHTVLTAANVDRFYPNDALFGASVDAMHL